MTSLSTPTDVRFANLLMDSFGRIVGSSLLPAGVDERDVSRWLYEDAPFVLLAHDTSADPLFVYANRTAQRCFEYSWDEIVGMPSRLSAEAPNREERQRLLDGVRRHGYVDDYRGLRIARSGRRFWIDEAIVWNLVDDEGTRHGQAALVRRWTDASRALGCAGSSKPS
ncbi:MEKHLA domain-containing protein [Nonomuraea lactucae]|uniref:MEKHLA domain-containing protein n=1 Tax=Nonomuraea lactucae TaxID=2249762 RepID=UPI000DE42A27|nr:MEKHLA domain-containing protein [Nonomuraea lactucae]